MDGFIIFEETWMVLLLLYLEQPTCKSPLGLQEWTMHWVTPPCDEI
jgi:hypothetical protein